MFPSYIDIYALGLDHALCFILEFVIWLCDFHWDFVLIFMHLSNFNLYVLAFGNNAMFSNCFQMSSIQINEHSRKVKNRKWCFIKYVTEQQ
jgi:hypothetical protein